MIRILKMITLGLVAAGLLVGCPKGDDDAKAEEPTEETKEETKEEEAKEEAKEEEEEEEETAEVDKEMYIKAAYEVTCVRAKVEDSETQKEILAEIYPRYGFTEESFTAAEGQLKDETTVQEAVKSKMDACTPEIAAAFKSAGADAEAKGEEEAEKEEAKDTEKKAAKPAVKPGKYTGAVTGGGLTDGKIEVTVRDDQGIYAKVSGKREGKRFLIPMKGSLSKDGQFNLSGKKGQNSLNAKGRVGKGAAAGRLTGQINRKPISVAFNAK